MRTTLIALVAALVLPSAAAAAPRKQTPLHPIAVWQLLGPAEDRALGEHWYGKIADALAAVPGVGPDRAREFGPRVQPAEGVTVAIRTATRWHDAAWLAYQRREADLALGMVDDALRLVEPYPAERLPEGLRRDLLLLRARTLVALDRLADARDALRLGMALDPSWEANPRFEPRLLVDLAAAVQGERAGVPIANIRVQTNRTNVQVLVSGVERARARSGVADLLLPPGVYEIAARKAGYAPAAAMVTVRPRQESEVALDLEVRNSARFQEQLDAALVEPKRQAGADVWESLRLAADAVEAQGVLAGRFTPDADGRGGTLHVGLYLPGRGGWAAWTALSLAGEGTDGFAADRAIEQITLALGDALHSAPDELAAR